MRYFNILLFVFAFNLCTPVLSQSESLDGRDRITIDVEHTKCEIDSDCIFMLTHCGDCDCGTAFNKVHEEHYRGLRSEVCKDRHVPVCDRSCLKTESKCVNKACTLVRSGMKD